jgi:hypothetical protein
MKKQRLEPTLVQKAILTINGFDKVFTRFQQQVALRDKGKLLPKLSKISR